MTLSIEQARTGNWNMPRLELGTLKRFCWYAVIIIFALLIERSVKRAEYQAAQERVRRADELSHMDGRYLRAWERAVKDQPDLLP